jgi:glycosyltransferase involved in cell wall biosynthesis
MRARSRVETARSGPSTKRPGRRCRLLIVSHAHLADAEPRKMALALQEHLDLRVVAPRRLPEPRHLCGRPLKPYRLDPDPRGREVLITFRALYRPGSPWVSQYALASLSLGMRRVRPDVIHLEHPPWSPLFWQVLLARRLFARSARIVLLLKKNTYRRYPGLTGRLKDALARAGLRWVDVVMPASAKAASMCERELGVSPDRLVVVTHLGVDPGVFRPGSDGRRQAGVQVVGYCGRFEPDKGLTDLVEAVERCRTITGADIRLRLLGTGSLQPDLERAAAARPWLEVMPPVPGDRVPSFLAGLDVFVLPSRVLPDHEEHDAHALLEALTVGVASIGTRSGIIPEVLADGAGIVVPAEDPEALARALADLARDPEARKRYARRGRQKADAEFILERVADHHVSIYESLCP